MFWPGTFGPVHAPNDGLRLEVTASAHQRTLVSEPLNALALAGGMQPVVHRREIRRGIHASCYPMRVRTITIQKPISRACSSYLSIRN